MEIKFLEILSAWALMFVTYLLYKDNESISLVRYDLLELENKLEALFKLDYQSKVSKVEQLLLSIKQILKKLTIYQVSLLFKNKKLEIITEESLKLIYRNEFENNEDANKASSIKAELLTLWGIEVANVYNPTKVVEFRDFFNASMFKRLGFCLKYALCK
tara:strand:+ start:1264 stop:1743 length:480 start_codon:yes stop_codon:yes gene_type:complete